MPISRGGSHDLTNLVTLCRRCHNTQHDHDITRSSQPGSSAGTEIVEWIFFPSSIISVHRYYSSSCISTLSGQWSISSAESTRS
ncbi:HNH endonuclease [Natrialba swarupiae]|nr:HNH endonuclease [Natrialba swarupiae]